MGIAPITGIPLPFVSVGGSSMIANLLAMGVLLAIHARGRRSAALRHAAQARRRLRRRSRRCARPSRRRSRSLVGGALADAARARALGGRRRASAGLSERSRAACEALVYVIGDSVTEEDERVLKRAHRARVPIVVVAAGRQAPRRIPFVLATDVVRVEPGHGFPVDDVARALARKLGEDGDVARRAPARAAAGGRARSSIESFARKNGIIGAAVFIPGVDLPVLTFNQMRLVLRICAAHGLEIDSAARA